MQTVLDSVVDEFNKVEYFVKAIPFNIYFDFGPFIWYFIGNNIINYSCFTVLIFLDSDCIFLDYKVDFRLRSALFWVIRLPLVVRLLLTRVVLLFVALVSVLIPVALISVIMPIVLVSAGVLLAMIVLLTMVVLLAWSWSLLLWTRIRLSLRLPVLGLISFLSFFLLPFLLWLLIVFGSISIPPIVCLYFWLISFSGVSILIFSPWLLPVFVFPFSPVIIVALSIILSSSIVVSISSLLVVLASVFFFLFDFPLPFNIPGGLDVGMQKESIFVGLFFLDKLYQILLSSETGNIKRRFICDLYLSEVGNQWMSFQFLH